MRTTKTFKETLDEFYVRYDEIRAREETDFSITTQKLLDSSQIILDVTKYVSELAITPDSLENKEQKEALDDFLNFCNASSLLQFRETILPTLVKSTTPYELEATSYQPLIYGGVFEAVKMYGHNMSHPIRDPNLSYLVNILNGFGYLHYIVGNYATTMIDSGINMPIDHIGEYEYQMMPVMMHDVCVHTFAMLNSVTDILSARLIYTGQAEQIEFIRQFQAHLNKVAINIIQQFRLEETIRGFGAKCVAEELIQEENKIAKLSENKRLLFKQRQEERRSQQQNKQQKFVEPASAEALEIKPEPKTPQEIAEEKLISLSVISDGTNATLKSINKDINDIRALVKNKLKRPLILQERIDIGRRLICFTGMVQQKMPMKFKELTELSQFISVLFDPKKNQPTDEEKLSINLIKADLHSIQAKAIYGQIMQPEYDLVEVKNIERGYLRPSLITADKVIERKKLLEQYGSVIESLKLNIEEITKSPANTKDSESHLAASMSIDQYNIVCKSFDDAIAYHEYQDTSRKENRADFLERLNAGKISKTEKTPEEKRIAEIIRSASEVFETTGQVNYEVFQSSKTQLQEVCGVLSGKLMETSESESITSRASSPSTVSRRRSIDINPSSEPNQLIGGTREVRSSSDPNIRY